MKLVVLSLIFGLFAFRSAFAGGGGGGYEIVDQRKLGFCEFNGGRIDFSMETRDYDGDYSDYSVISVWNKDDEPKKYAFQLGWMKMKYDFHQGQLRSVVQKSESYNTTGKYGYVDSVHLNISAVFDSRTQGKFEVRTWKDEKLLDSFELTSCTKVNY